MKATQQLSRRPVGGILGLATSIVLSSLALWWLFAEPTSPLTVALGVLGILVGALLLMGLAFASRWRGMGAFDAHMGYRSDSSWRGAEWLLPYAWVTHVAYRWGYESQKLDDHREEEQP